VAATPALHWARRVITRPQVVGDEPFEGVTSQEFGFLSQAGAFALEWPAHGLRYGIRATEFAALAKGSDVVFNGSRAALPLALEQFPNLIVLRISAPSKVLAERLAARGRETMAEIEARLARASYAVPDGMAVIDITNDATPEVGIARLLAALQAKLVR
jgi:phosphonate metabolism protein PhnN/1,5-bisphosphokinase (PRPP-forming)